jgi:predicted Zn-ribbon and HTH transcriptional regulator
LIEHQCPQCGAPATLEETDHLFVCGFCKVKSFLQSRDFFRYVLPHKAPEGKSLVYIPYWRFKGCLFSCVSGGIRQKIVDVSRQGLGSRYFPVSLGLRSQTLKLRFVSPETEGRFLNPTLSHSEVLDLVEKRFSASLPKPLFAQAFVGETLSQIYAPFYIEDKVYDAVLNRAVSSASGEDVRHEALPGGRPDWRVQFLPALCPHCGWDLEGQRDSLALNCKNCNSLWMAGKKGFTKVSFGAMPEDGKQITYLPFYRIKAAVSGIGLDSYADLIQLANLPKVVREEWKTREFRFWSPAFKVRPLDLLRFARNLTLSQPEKEFAPVFPEGEIHPVTLSVQEAVESLKINLASFMKPRRILFPKLQDIHIKARSFVLIYVPFHIRGNELSQPAFQLRLNKNLLTYARHL